MTNPGPGYRYCPACKTPSFGREVKNLGGKASTFEKCVHLHKCPHCHEWTDGREWKLFHEMRESAEVMT